MKYAIALLAVSSVACFAQVRTATEDYVTNRVAAARAELVESNAAASAAIAAEALLRIAGDAAGTNYADVVKAELIDSNATDRAAVAANYLSLTGGVMAASAAVTLPGAISLRLRPSSVYLSDGMFDSATLSNTSLLFNSPFSGTSSFYEYGQVSFRMFADTWIWQYPKDETPGALTVASREWAYPVVSNIVGEAVAAIPRVPTNAVQGWLMYDPGSNMWLRVSVSNWSFTVWEVTP